MYVSNIGNAIEFNFIPYHLIFMIVPLVAFVTLNRKTQGIITQGPCVTPCQLEYKHCTLQYMYIHVLCFIVSDYLLFVSDLLFMFPVLSLLNHAPSEVLFSMLTRDWNELVFFIFFHVHVHVHAYM